MYTSLVEDNEALNKRIAELEAQVTEIPTLCRRYESRIAELEAERDRLIEAYAAEVAARQDIEAQFEALLAGDAALREGE